MIRIGITILLGILTTSFSSAQDLKSMTFNVRFDNPGDGTNQWEERKTHVVDIIEKFQPDVLGIQEAMDHQVAYLKEALPGYSFTGVGRDDGKAGGEYSGIFYDSSVVMIDGSTFWLSDTPKKPSKGWDAALPRICTYGLFEHRESGREFWMFNTHFDHVGKDARTKSAELILKKITELNKENLPVILTGDFNATISEPPIQTLLRDLYLPIDYEGPHTTFTGFDSTNIIDRRIDFIFSHGLVSHAYIQINNRREGGFISDHLPVYREMSFVTESDDSLSRILREKDQLMFEEGFNNCFLEVTESLITDDLEFYHDTGGVTRGKNQFMEDLRSGLCKTGKNPTKRKLVPGTLEVFPLYYNGELYGAVQNGIHSFYQMEAKFSHLWLLVEGEWKIARVLSYNHRTVEK
jgi:endonuclease/exonuclease/phosphatase family metal-dependent hydrolase